MSIPSPPGVTFVDTNVLIYSHDTHDQAKHRAAENLLAQLWTTGLGVLSTQVLQEFYSAATRKLQPPLTPAQARQVVHDYSEWCRVDTDPLLIISAGRLSEQHSINFWDALIIEAARRAGATELITEDLNHGCRFGELTVRNPFCTR
ncbi:MAG: PIN domain-containing protein [Pseudonocardiales bacterium]|nr:PIN domain-containing protein [Pseudonocardiales bacterium]MBV9728285.1 PIN domain-containing protein [Pseudonocardiales bacterium]